MELFSTKTNFDFLGKRYYWIGFSVLLSFLCVYEFISKGDAVWGLDFSGGTEILINYEQDVESVKIREAISNAGFEESVVQKVNLEGYKLGNSFSIRIPQKTTQAEKRVSLENELKKLGTNTLIKEDFVGPIIGNQIKIDGVKALIWSLIAMLVYIGFRFEWRFGVGALVALTHDCIVALGISLLSGRQISGGTLAALLTIVGYSVNDTIIIFDRIRENIEKARKQGGSKYGLTKTKLTEIMNLSVNETLSRTIITSLTVFFVVTTLWLFGGGAVSDLAFALVIGVIIGTYSSVFIASPIVLMCQKDETIDKKLIGDKKVTNSDAGNKQSAIV